MILLIEFVLVPLSDWLVFLLFVDCLHDFLSLFCAKLGMYFLRCHHSRSHVFGLLLGLLHDNLSLLVDLLLLLLLLKFEFAEEAHLFRVIFRGISDDRIWSWGSSRLCQLLIFLELLRGGERSLSNRLSLLFFLLFLKFSGLLFCLLLSLHGWSLQCLGHSQFYCSQIVFLFSLGFLIEDSFESVFGRLQCILLPSFPCKVGSLFYGVSCSDLVKQSISEATGSIMDMQMTLRM